MFHPPRDRSADDSIRGYVYQIDRTVWRWIHLPANQCLELECGEDIDLVGHLLTLDEAQVTESRLLEQIKLRGQSVTLRSQSARESLANFYDHCQTNPLIDLRFCFLTNANAGREQLSPFANGIPAIVVWEQIRTGELTGDALIGSVETLQKFLRQLPKPEDLPERVWTGWQSFLTTASAKTFLEFILRFEWSMGQPSAEQLPMRIRADVVALGYAKDEIEAEAVVERMFVHVARLISESDLKRLTVEGRVRLLSAPTLPLSDRKALADLRKFVGQLDSRVEKLEEFRAETIAQQAMLSGRLDEVLLGAVSHEKIDFRPSIELAVPEPVARLSARARTVSNLASALRSCHWLSICGGPDTGKSQLAVQIAKLHGKCRGWLRFHHAQSSVEAARFLEAGLLAILGWTRRPKSAMWYLDAISTIGANSLVLFDDLPRFTGDDPLAERLIQFGQAAAAANVCVLSTSRFPAPARLHHELGEKRYREIAVPAFNDAEARDLFGAYGAPSQFLDGPGIQFLNGQAAGHPLLLSATAEFLLEHDWRLQDDEIRALLRGDHKQGIMPEVIERLTRTLGNAARELLYRLTLPTGQFEQTEIATLAGVDPKIDRPQEQLNVLLGPWVQRDTLTKFTVSPLAKPLGKTELSTEAQILCFRALANLIAQKHVINHEDGSRAIDYNLQAGEVRRASFLYVLSLVAALKHKPTGQIAQGIDRWRMAPLPDQLTVGEQLFVRGYQLAAFSKYELDIGLVVKDIDALLPQARQADSWGILALAVQNLGRFAAQDPQRALRYVRLLITFPVVYGPHGEELRFDRLHFPDMLWMFVPYLRTSDLLSDWLHAVESMSEEARTRFWASDLARKGIWLVPNQLYLSEWIKPKSSQDWDGTLCVMNEALGRVQKLREPRLEAAFAARMMDIHADRKQVDLLPNVAKPVLERWPNHPDVQFRIRGTLGRSYAYAQRPELALAILDAALSQPSDDDHERLRYLLAAHICVQKDDHRYVTRARDLARTSQSIPQVEAARGLGEYAISMYDLHDGKKGAIAAFSAWSETMRCLFGVADKEKIWRDLFVLFAHATSYFTLAACDKSPTETLDGDKWIAPSRGFLLKEYMPEREASYQPSGDATIMWLMQQYAVAAGAFEEANYWMRQASEAANRAGASFIQVMLGRDKVGALLTGDAYEGAIEAGVFAGRGMAVSNSMENRTRENFDGRSLDLNVEFRKLPKTTRSQGDCFAVIAAVVPAAMRLASKSLSDAAFAASVARRIASLCRQLSDDEWGDAELWRSLADMFETCGDGPPNARPFIDRARTFGGQDERSIALRTVACILAACHGSPEEAIHCQLACAEFLLRWFAPDSPVHFLVLLPCIEEYWEHVCRESRFALRAPDVTIDAIRSAAKAPSAIRAQAILCAAAGGFQVGKLDHVVRRFREAIKKQTRESESAS